MIEVVECLDAARRQSVSAMVSFTRPADGDDRDVAVERLADGNTSRVKSIGEGVAEIRIDRGPGYRVYFGWDGRTLVVLLGGGSKRRQQRDIADALALWRQYKARQVGVRRR
jgi:putative addiction module killer protein